MTSWKIDRSRHPGWLFGYLMVLLNCVAWKAMEADAAESFTAAQTALYERCESGQPPDRIRDCSSAIDSKSFHGTQLAGLYLNRANAYDATGDKDNARSDYSKAIEPSVPM